LPELDIDDPLQRELLAGCFLIYACDPFASGRILGCRMERGRGLVPLFAVFQPEVEESPADVGYQRIAPTGVEYASTLTANRCGGPGERR
jgi:hypothetical protein